MSPGRIESLYEIGYLTIGRSSIYIIALLQLVNSLGMIMLYFIVFGDTSASVSEQLIFEAGTDNFFATRTFFVLILSVVLLPVVI